MKHNPGRPPNFGLRHHFCYENNTPFDAAKECVEAAALTEAERAEVQCNILMLRDLAPEFEGFVKECAKEKLIIGWRALMSVKIL